MPHPLMPSKEKGDRLFPISWEFCSIASSL
jgi:hypothetical protein